MNRKCSFLHYLIFINLSVLTFKRLISSSLLSLSWSSVAAALFLGEEPDSPRGISPETAPCKFHYQLDPRQNRAEIPRWSLSLYTFGYYSSVITKISIIWLNSLSLRYQVLFCSLFQYRITLNQLARTAHNILNVSLTSWPRPQANKLHWHFLESGDSFYFFFMCFGANQKVLFVLLFSCLPGESKAHFPGTRAFSHSGTSETADAMKDAHTLFFKRMLFFRSRLNVLFPLDRRF